VRTFAEDHTQFVVPPEAATDTAAAVRARAVAVSLPSVLVSALLIVVAVRAWERSVPPLERVSDPLCFRLGWLRWPCAGLLAAVVVVLAGVPLTSLMWKAGLAGSPRAWTLHHGKTACRRRCGSRQAGDREPGRWRARGVTAGLGLLTRGCYWVRAAGSAAAWSGCWPSRGHCRAR
jgi:ABC-type Fe3+ transport system permease subunit